MGLGKAVISSLAPYFRIPQAAFGKGAGLWEEGDLTGTFALCPFKVDGKS